MILILDNELDTRYSSKVPLEEFDLFDIVDGVKLVEQADLVVVLDVTIGKMLVLKDKFTGESRIENADGLSGLVSRTVLRRALAYSEKINGRI